MNEQFPEGASVAFRDVLDIACGSGDWVIQFAEGHDHSRVVGIDHSSTNLETALHRIDAAGENGKPFPPKAEFLPMDILKPLLFSDESFDYVNAWSLSSFLAKDAWGHVLAECSRILRPAGLIHLVDTQLSHTSSSAYKRFLSLLAHALHNAGIGFSSMENGSNATIVQQHLLQADFDPLVQRSEFLNFSFGETEHTRAVQNMIGIFNFTTDFLVAMNVASRQELKALYDQALDEMRQPDFCWYECVRSTWAEKRV